MLLPSYVKPGVRELGTRMSRSSKLSARGRHWLPLPWKQTPRTTAAPVGVGRTDTGGAPEGTRGPSERRPGPRGRSVWSVLVEPAHGSPGAGPRVPLCPASYRSWPLQFQRQKPSQTGGGGRRYWAHLPGNVWGWRRGWAVKSCQKSPWGPQFRGHLRGQEDGHTRGQAWIPHSLPGPLCPLIPQVWALLPAGNPGCSIFICKMG